MFAAQQNEADLRPVAVGDDNAITARQQIRDLPRGFDHGGILIRHALVFCILDEGVAADGDDKNFHAGESAKPSRNSLSRSAAMCAASRVSTTQCTLTVVMSSLANARSCAISKMLAPSSATSPAKRASPPGRSLIVAVKRCRRPSEASPRSSTRPRIGVSMLPPLKGRTTFLPFNSGTRLARHAASGAAPAPLAAC